MKVFRCDRCGKIIEECNNSVDVDFVDTTRYMDLCERCAEDFNNWLSDANAFAVIRIEDYNKLANLVNAQDELIGVLRKKVDGGADDEHSL